MPRATKRRNDGPHESFPPRPPVKRIKTDKIPTRGSRLRARSAAKAPPLPALNPLPTVPTHTRPCNSVFVWGTGEDGQFGMGVDHLGEFIKPQRAKWFDKATEEGILGGEGCGIEAVAAGGFFSLFVDEEGKVWSCGNNDDAALGRTTENVPDPAAPGHILDVDVAQSEPHTIQSLIDEHFRAVVIAAGSSIAGAIDDQGDLRVWGTFRASDGVLGFSSGVRNQPTPTPIIDLKSKAGDPEKFVALASGNNHMLALSTHGNVFAWGAGEDGQLGRRIVERRKIHGVVPEKVILGSRSRKAVAIGAGSRHSFAVDEVGDVWSWGMDAVGQTGTDRPDRTENPTVILPTKVLALSCDRLEGSRIVSCAGGDDHTIFLSNDGRVFACGKSDGGRLGLPKDHPAILEHEHGSLPIPTHVPFPESHESDPVVHIAVGTRASMAVTAAGALYSWGEANASELGIKDDETGKAAQLQLTPKMIVKKVGGSWSAVSTACGGQHVCALLRKRSERPYE